MRALKADGCAAQFILITAFESVKTAVAAVKEGAFDYLSKPIDNEEILLTARRALEVSNLRLQVANYRETLSRLRGPAQLIGLSPALQAVVHAAERASTSDINVLLTGESGTGKDLVKAPSSSSTAGRCRRRSRRARSSGTKRALSPGP